MTWMRQRALAGAICFFLLPATSFAAKVKIGFINSMTGPEAPIAENLTNAVTLAMQDLKKNGIDVELIKEDDGGKPELSMASFEKLATRDKVAGIVGPYSSKCAAAVAKLAEKYSVPLLIPVAAKDDITKQGNQWVFRLSATTKDYATILLDMVTRIGKPKSIAILHENSDFGVSGASAANAYAATKGLKVVATEAYAPGSQDFRGTLMRVKDQEPDLVFMVSYVADAILLMRQSRELEITPKAFLGAGAGFATQQFAQEKEISSYVFSSTQWTRDVNWPGARSFADRYLQKFGKEPTYHAATAYESMVIMARTAAKSGSAAQLRQHLKSGSWNGILGQVKFKDYEGYTNQNSHQMLVEQIVDGVHRTVYPPFFEKPIYPFPGWTK
jgi:branched-chain amino acid transport system substrate-binding protein